MSRYENTNSYKNCNKTNMNCLKSMHVCFIAVSTFKNQHGFPQENHKFC